MNSSDGFNTSSRRLFGELALVTLGLIALAALLWFGARFAARLLVEHMPLEAERTLGKMAWESLAPSDRRCTSKRTLQYVGDILRPLLAQQPPGYRFQYTVVDDPSLNAFALPGGYITVNFGLLREIERSEELAGVLAHELAHVTQRHSTRRLATQLSTLAAVGFVFGGGDLNTATQLLVTLISTAYARDQEEEADAVGLQTLRSAHIDAQGMSELFERIAAQSPSLPEILSTHPDPGKRAERAREFAPDPHVAPLPSLPRDLSCR